MTSVPAQLAQHRIELQQLDPLDATAQAIEYNPEHWAVHIGRDDEDFAFLTEAFPRAITRGNLAGLARTAHAQRDSDSARRLFLATMMWGYGTVGYGPYRTREMLGTGKARRLLLSTLERIRNGDIRAAYDGFQLPMCGSAFFTKYFYFAGLGCDLSVAPLILDSMVMNELEQGLGLDVKRYAPFTRKDGRIAVVGRDSARYDHYLRRLHGWAATLGCRADSIELFLFKRRRALANGASAAPPITRPCV